MKAFLCTAALAAFSMNAMAGVIAFSGQADSVQVSARADYTFSANTLVIEITNELINQTSVGQAISGIDFTLTGGLTGNLTSKTGELINVGKNGVVSTAGVMALDWIQLTGFHTTALGSSGPDQTILGAPNASGVYSNANGSIAKNGPNNPFVKQRAVLTYTVNGATSSTAFKSFAFSFGNGLTPVSIPLGGDDPAPVPEPASMALLGAGLGVVGCVGKRLRKG